MRKTIRPTALSGLLGSKRFIVAVCAAIAMVLGAMSAGASFFVPNSAADKQQSAHVPVFTEHHADTLNPVQEKEASSIFAQPLFIVAQTVAKPLLAPLPPQSSKSALSIEFGPVSANDGIMLGQLQVKPEIPLLPPPTPNEDAPAIVTPPTEPTPPPDPGTTNPPTTTAPTSATGATEESSPTATPSETPPPKPINQTD